MLFLLTLFPFYMEKYLHFYSTSKMHFLLYQRPVFFFLNCPFSSYPNTIFLKLHFTSTMVRQTTPVVLKLERTPDSPGGFAKTDAGVEPGVSDSAGRVCEHTHKRLYFQEVSSSS